MIGERIKKARKVRGYSVEQVAEHLSIHPATLYRYENGEISKMPAQLIKPLCEYLRVSPYYLLEMQKKEKGA